MQFICRSCFLLAFAWLCFIQPAVAEEEPAPLAVLAEAQMHFDLRGSKSHLQSAISLLRGIKPDEGSITERYDARILLARALLWQLNPMYVHDYGPGGADEDTLLAEAEDSITKASALASQVGSGASEPCEANYWTAVLRIARHSPASVQMAYIQDTIGQLEQLRELTTRNGQKCDAYDDSGIDRYAGRSYYRLADIVTGRAGGTATPEAIALWEKSKQMLGAAYGANPQNFGNAIWYAFTLMAVLAGQSSPEGKEAGCKVIQDFASSPTPASLAGLDPFLSDRKHRLTDTPLCR
jgi:hypothetical protein